MVDTSMVVVAIGFNIDTLKADVIRRLCERSRRPIELLASLGDNYPDDRIKEAVLRLLQEGDIEVTSDRLLRVTHHAI